MAERRFLDIYPQTSGMQFASGRLALIAPAELFVTGATGETVDRTPFVAVRDGTYCGSGGTPAPKGYRGARRDGATRHRY